MIANVLAELFVCESQKCNLSHTHAGASVCLERGRISRVAIKTMAYNRIVFNEDDKLPDDVLRKEYFEGHDLLCCLKCGFESESDPSIKDPLDVRHRCS
jgi:hypothetical protein